MGNRRSRSRPWPSLILSPLNLLYTAPFKFALDSCTHFAASPGRTCLWLCVRRSWSHCASAAPPSSGGPSTGARCVRWQAEAVCVRRRLRALGSRLSSRCDCAMSDVLRCAVSKRALGEHVCVHRCGYLWAHCIMSAQQNKQGANPIQSIQGAAISGGLIHVARTLEAAPP